MWIGTEEQYLNNKAAAAAAQHGLRRAQIDGEGDGARTYVGNGPSTQVGSTRIYDLDVSVIPPEQKRGVLDPEQ